jgi:RimJ/RimL family protein N-acetyltransferase
MLKGQHVVLRRVEPRDHEDIQRWQNDPEVFRRMDYIRPFSLDDIHESERRAIEEGHPFIIEVEGRGIGRTGLNNFRRRDRIASLYIFVGERDAWGHGHGYDAIMTLLRYGFDNLGLRIIELWMLGDNERAAALYKKIGFVEDARLPNRSFHAGTYIDHMVMSIDGEGFERARSGWDAG